MSGTKQYPTRIHEVLKMEEKEIAIFKTPGLIDKEFMLRNGVPHIRFVGDIHWKEMDGASLMRIINHPERITRRPRLTEEQVKRLRALIALEAMYLAKNKDGSVGAFTNKPTKNALYWNANDSYCFYLSIVGTCLSDLVSWSDPEPLDIVQTLRDAGCEIEGVE